VGGLPEYITLTPIGDHKEKYLMDFLGSLRSLDPPPVERVVCLDLDTSLPLEIFTEEKILFSPAIDAQRTSLERICYAREILRNYFLKTKVDYALWIDSDILVPPEIFKVLYEVMEKKKVWIVVNKYLGSPTNYWCGSACMLTHRQACMASRFWVGEILTPEGEIKHLSEDFIFFSIFDQGGPFLKLWTGRSGRVCDQFVTVKHLRVEK